MKNLTLWTALLVAGCAAEPTENVLFACESDTECLDGYRCDVNAGYCRPGGSRFDLGDVRVAVDAGDVGLLADAAVVDAAVVDAAAVDAAVDAAPGPDAQVCLDEICCGEGGPLEQGTVCTNKTSQCAPRAQCGGVEYIRDEASCDGQGRCVPVEASTYLDETSPSPCSVDERCAEDLGCTAAEECGAAPPPCDDQPDFQGCVAFGDPGAPGLTSICVDQACVACNNGVCGTRGPSVFHSVDPLFVQLLSFADETPVVVDVEAGLLWQKASLAGTYLWQDAARACAASTAGRFTDWRLPDLYELRALVRIDEAQGRAIRPPFTIGPQQLYFWSSTQGGLDGAERTVSWTVKLGGDGRVLRRAWDRAHSVICVRGARATQRFDRFDPDPEGGVNRLVFDRWTGLEWTLGVFEVMSIESASGFCERLAMGLPDVRQLSTLLDFRDREGALWLLAPEFDHGRNAFLPPEFWTRDPSEAPGTGNWWVNFLDGTAQPAEQMGLIAAEDLELSVRCVRQR